MKNKLLELKAEIDNSTIIVGYCNTSLLIIDGNYHKINWETKDLNNT